MGGIALLLLGIAGVVWANVNLTAAVQAHNQNCIDFADLLIPEQCASLASSIGLLRTGLFVVGLFAPLGVILVIFGAALGKGLP